MSHLVPQARISRNLVNSPLRSPGASRSRRAATPARADQVCDFYMRLPAGSDASRPAQYVQIGRAACPVQSVAAPALRAAQPSEATAASSDLETLGALQAIGLASTVGAVMGGQAAADAAKGNKPRVPVADQVAVAVPGALLGGLAGLGVAGRVLTVVLPKVVHFGLMPL